MIRKQSHNRAICHGDRGSSPKSKREDYDSYLAAKTRMMAWSTQFLEKIKRETKNAMWRKAAKETLRNRK